MTKQQYRVKCVRCGEEIGRGSSMQTLLERFFELVSRHNLESMDYTLCPDAKSEISMNDLRGAFAGDNPEFVIEKAIEYTPTGWEKADDN